MIFGQKNPDPYFFLTVAFRVFPDEAATHQAPSVELAITVEPSATVSSPSHGELLSAGDPKATLFHLEV